MVDLNYKITENSLKSYCSSTFIHLLAMTEKVEKKNKKKKVRDRFRFYNKSHVSVGFCPVSWPGQHNRFVLSVSPYKSNHV